MNKLLFLLLITSAFLFTLASSKEGNARSNIRTVGNLKQLVLLVNFKDAKTTYQRKNFEALFNQKGYSRGGAKGSIRDYFLEASYGQLEIESVVTDWIELDHPVAYYAKGKSTVSHGTNIQKMGIEALAKLDASGFDFRSFDKDGDGVMDMAVCIIHQGVGGEDMVVHEKNVAGRYVFSHYGVLEGVNYDGVTIDCYHTEGELDGIEKGINKIRVICHEMGHGLRLPELYNANRKAASVSPGLGNFDIMSMKPNLDQDHPLLPSAWTRIKLGWAKPKLLSASQKNIPLPPANKKAAFYKITMGMKEGEYLLLENRQKLGFDAENLPGTGLLIYHVDESMWDGKTFNASLNNSDRNHYHVGLLEADGKGNMRMRSYFDKGAEGVNEGEASDFFPGTGNVTSISSESDPYFRSYKNGKLPFSIENIRESNGKIIFDFLVKKKR